MNNSPIDSLAHFVAPDAQFSNIYWWIGGLVVFILSVAGFVIKHYTKGRFLDLRPRPKVLVKDGSRYTSKVTYPKTGAIDIQQEVVKQSGQKIEELKKKYKVNDLDVYQNMNLIFQSNFNTAANYNNDVASYLEDMELFYQRTITDQLMTSCYKPIDLAVYAKGRKTCSNLLIQITIEGDLSHLFAANSRVQKVGKRDIAPENNRDDRSSDIYGLIPNDQEDYSYYEWILKPITPSAQYQSQSLVSGFHDHNIIPEIWVDTRFSQNIAIHWKINGDDIRESGKQGTICVTIK